MRIVTVILLTVVIYVCRLALAVGTGVLVAETTT